MHQARGLEPFTFQLQETIQQYTTCSSNSFFPLGLLTYGLGHFLPIHSCIHCSWGPPIGSQLALVLH